MIMWVGTAVIMGVGIAVIALIMGLEPLRLRGLEFQ